MFAQGLHWQIKRLIAQLPKKQSSEAEINKLLEIHNDEAHIFLLCSLFDEIDFKESKSAILKDVVKVCLVDE